MEALIQLLGVIEMYEKLTGESAPAEPDRLHNWLIEREMPINAQLVQQYYL